MSYMSGPGIYPDLGANHDEEVRGWAVAAVLSGSMSVLSAAAWYRVQVHDLDGWLDQHLDSRLADPRDARVAGDDGWGS
jgi:transposase-like protein